jgi:hypothetical protein
MVNMILAPESGIRDLSKQINGMELYPGIIDDPVKGREEASSNGSATAHEIGLSTRFDANAGISAKPDHVRS